MTNYAHVLATYTRVRKIRFHLNNALAKSLSKEILEEGGRRLGLFQRGILVFDSEEELPILLDFCIYNDREDGRNAVERFLAESPPPPNSEEMALLKDMQRAYYTLIEVQDVVRGVGVTVTDLLRGGTAFLADIGFSHSAHPGAIMATRIIPMEDFLTTGGAALPVNPPALAIIQKELRRTFGPECDYHQLTPQQEAELAALVIRTCLKTGAASQVAYTMPGQGSPSKRVTSREAMKGLMSREAARPRANRNDPCPCGSGRKYKSCCGKR